MSTFGTPFMSNLNGADRLALAIPRFLGRTIHHFEQQIEIWPFASKIPWMGGKEEQVIGVGRAVDDSHVPGAELASGVEPLTEDNRVPLDEFERISHWWLNQRDMNFALHDGFERFALKAGGALSRRLDGVTFRHIARGARKPARTATGTTETFDSGVLIQRSDTESFTTSYPNTTTGAKRIQDDLATAMEQLNLRDVEITTPVMFMPIGLKKVLRQDKALQSGDFDFQNMNDLIEGRFEKVEGWAVKFTNTVNNNQRLFNADGASSGTIEPESNHRADFTKTAMVGVAHPEAISALVSQPITTDGPRWYPERHAWLAQAFAHTGVKATRFEACVEIFTSATPYTEQNGEFAP